MPQTFGGQSPIFLQKFSYHFWFFEKGCHTLIQASLELMIYSPGWPRVIGTLLLFLASAGIQGYITVPASAVILNEHACTYC